ncbi:MAG: hypothetical protein JO171_14450 [Paludibacterium sp.]|uniref:hypothetical protein n=1 Tax=Paludibacterium sp. TaxID=1917523 RepID=UPI0025E389B6|nr:hypothetical protein [Paludibacterium sp.]MBV8048353.1 hypothetical protein [Paludibacterium sp.]
MINPIPHPDRLDAEALSALRSLLSGFPSLQRAHDTTRRYTQPASPDAALAPATRARHYLLAALHPVLAQFMALGIPAGTMLHDVPLLLASIRHADKQIRDGHGFAGF